MATLFVSPFGDNTSPGTLDAPFRTIEKGLKGLTAPGDVLYLRVRRTSRLPARRASLAHPS